jgi:hypothetical protein
LVSPSLLLRETALIPLPPERALVYPLSKPDRDTRLGTRPLDDEPRARLKRSSGLQGNGREEAQGPAPNVNANETEQPRTLAARTRTRLGTVPPPRTSRPLVT